MKKIILSISLFTFTLSFAQNIKYSFGQEFETVKKHQDFGFYKFSNNKYAEVYFKKEEDMMFQIYDEKFNTIQREETAILPVIGSKHVAHEMFKPIKDNYYWFYSTWDRKTETERLFAQPFNQSNFKFTSNPINLIETGRLTDVYDKYHFSTSTDSSKLLVTYKVKPKIKRDKLNKDIIGFNLFDSQMKKLFAAEIEMPYSEFDMDNLGYKVDSRGNIYMLTQVKLSNSLDGEANKENKNAYRYELVRVNQKESKLEVIKIELENKYTSSVSLTEDLQHNIVVTGYYSNKKNSVSTDGAYIAKLELNDNSSTKKFNITYCEFPLEVLKAYESERAKKKMDKKNKKDDLEANNLKFDRVVFEKDGSMVIIGEVNYIITYTYMCGKSMCTSTSYYSEDIYILKADNTGKAQWCSKIPKSQYGDYSNMSHHFHQYNGEYYFFYLDNIKNQNLPLTEAPISTAGGRGSYLNCVKIDGNGKMTKKFVFDPKEEEVRIYPREFESINQNIIVDRLNEDRKHSKVFKLEID